MQRNTLNKIVNIALVTSPVMALLVISPIFLAFANPTTNFWITWSFLTFLSLCFWTVQVALSFLVKNNKYKKYWNFIFVILINMIAVGVISTGFHFINSHIFSQPYHSKVLRSIIVISVNLMIYVLNNLIYSKETQLQLNQENASLKFNSLDAEYKLLKEQLNPHFLYNALNISKSLIRLQPKQAENYILQLSDFLRLSIHNEKKSSTLKEELEMCEIYISLQKVSFDSQINFSVEAPKEFLKYHLPFFSLITLVENAIKHNSFSIKDPLNISVLATEDIIEVKNNKQTVKKQKHSNTGLANLNKRSQLLCGSEIAIFNSEEEFAVKVKLFQI